ncbi:unnamed protein product [Sympodiomycopsis kandeliae]
MYDRIIQLAQSEPHCWIPRQDQLTNILWSRPVSEAYQALREQKYASETELVQAFSNFINRLRRVAAAYDDSDAFWEDASRSTAIIAWEVKNLMLERSSGPTTKARTEVPPRLPSTMVRNSHRVITPWLQDHLRSRHHDDTASGQLGVPKPDAVFVHSSLADFKPSTHQVAYEDVGGFAEFKLKPSSKDVRDAIEQALLEIAIQKDQQPFAGNSLVWTVSEEVIRCYYINNGVVLRLAKVEYKKEAVKMAELIFLMLSFVTQKRMAPATLDPSSRIPTVDGSILRWLRPVQAQDVLNLPASRNVPFRLGGKNTYVVAGDAAVFKDGQERSSTVVMKWYWPRTSSATSEIKMLEVLADARCESISKRLPGVLMAGVVSCHQGPIELAAKGDAELSEMIRDPVVLVVTRRLTETWDLSPTHVLALIADMAWLSSVMWCNMRFVHGDLSATNVASLLQPQQLDEKTDEMKRNFASRINSISVLEDCLSIDTTPIAAILDVENSRICRDGEDTEVDTERRLALSATQAFWAATDWSMWRDSLEGKRRVETDLESLLYVMIAVLSFKANQEDGKHWMSWSPEEWEKLSRTSPKAFRSALAARTTLSQPNLDMVSEWKGALWYFQAKERLIEAEDEDGGAQEEALAAAREEMMRKVILCVTRAALSALDAI